MSTVPNLEKAEILFALGLLPAEQLSDVAVGALQEGVTSGALIQLAGLLSVEVDDAPRLFLEALRELGRAVPSKHAALHAYALAICEEIVVDNSTGYDAAKRIWAARRTANVDCHQVDPFVYAASEYEDRPKERDFFSKAIVDEALRWVRGTPSVKDCEVAEGLVARDTIRGR